MAEVPEHRVRILPGTGGLRLSVRVADAAGDVYGQPFTVSAILEQHATPSQKQRKIDIADYFFEK